MCYGITRVFIFPEIAVESSWRPSRPQSPIWYFFLSILHWTAVPSSICPKNGSLKSVKGLCRLRFEDVGGCARAVVRSHQLKDRLILVRYVVSIEQLHCGTSIELRGAADE